MSIDHIVAAYTLTDEDKAQLANTLAKGYLLAKVRAYQRAQSKTRHVIRIHKPWQVTESEVEKSQQWAFKQVESIAETYETLLRHAIEDLPEERAIGDVMSKAKEKAKEKAKQLAEWFLLFLPWKTKQIADHTWSTGDNAGTQQFISDVQDKSNASGKQSNDNISNEPNKKNVHEIVDGGRSMLKAVVLPAHSSSDECEKIAGKRFALNAAPSLPMHINCIHYLEMVIDNE